MPRRDGSPFVHNQRGGALCAADAEDPEKESKREQREAEPFHSMCQEGSDSHLMGLPGPTIKTLDDRPLAQSDVAGVPPPATIRIDNIATMAIVGHAKRARLRR